MKKLTKRVLATLLTGAMILGGVNLPSVNVKASGDQGISYKTILGDAVSYGVVAGTFTQKNHAQTNFATKSYIFEGNCLEPDLLEANVVPFLIGSIGTNPLKFGASCYYKDNPNQSVKYDITAGTGVVYIPGTYNLGNGSQILIDNNGKYTVDFKKSDTVNATVDSMIAAVKAKSNYLASQPATITYSDANVSDINNLLIDTTGYNDKVIYVNLTGTKCKQAAEAQGIKITKNEDQLIVFNIADTDYTLKNYRLTVKDNGNTLLNGETSEGDTGVNSEKNQKLLKYFMRSIVWNFPNGKNITLTNTAGLFLIPGDTADVTMSGTSTGWLVSGGKATSDHGQWHFPFQFSSDSPGAQPKAVNISKQNVGGEEIAGASMALYEGKNVTAGTPVDSWVSEAGKTHTVERSRLKFATYYTIHEVTAPNGYEVATDITFKIGTDGKITNVVAAASSNAETGLIVMLDAAKPVIPKDVSISKRNAGGEEIAGASMTLYEGKNVTTGTAVDTWTSEAGKSHTVSGLVLKLNTYYTIHEVAAPSGYEVATDITFQVGADGKITDVVAAASSNAETGLIVMLDAAKKGSDKDGSESTGTGDLIVTITDEKTDEPVPGAKVEITTPNGSKTNHTTDETGSIIIKNTATGDYTVVITEVPQGYTVTTNKEIVVTVEKGQTTTRTITKNSKDAKNADKALRHAADVKTGDDSFGKTISLQKSDITQLSAKNNKKISKKYNKKLKKYKKAHKKQAKEVAAWVTIAGTRINYPVMYTGIKNNTKYLHKNISGQEDPHGMLFASYLTPKRRISYNNIIYGHNMKDRSMFADLDKYASKSFYKGHKYVKLDTEGYNYVYEVVEVFRISCVKGSKDRMIYEKFAQIDNKKTFNKWKKQLVKNREYKCSGKYNRSDNLMILSTCEYSKENGRLAVLCKQIKCNKVK